jgi:NADPH:quinone reductase-like Zn-dependent oxidoreductase
MTTSTTIQEMQNPSIVLYGAKNAKLEDTPVPPISDPHHVLVRIAYVGVCGSDVSIISLCIVVSISSILLKQAPPQYLLRQPKINPPALSLFM